jgi:hypothetical protein
MLLTRRSFAALTTGAVACTAFGAPAISSPSREYGDFETFRRLSQEQHFELVGGYVRQNMQRFDGAMWSGRMVQNYASVLPAALASGASSFAEVERAFSLDFLISAEKDERLPVYMRSRLRAAVSVIPSYDDTKGTEQSEIFHDHLNYMFRNFNQLFAELALGYPGSSRDMSNGAFDWSRTSHLAA